MSKTDHVIKAEYLHNSSGAHDKVYNIALRFRNDNYEVVAEYGRRTSVLKQLTKYTGLSETSARMHFADLVNEKVKGGYKIVNTDRSGRSNLVNIPVSGNNKTPAQLRREEIVRVEEAKKNVYNPEAIPDRRLDFDDL